jgi:hypothetical protein
MYMELYTIFNKTGLIDNIYFNAYLQYAEACDRRLNSFLGQVVVLRII